MAVYPMIQLGVYTAVLTPPASPQNKLNTSRCHHAATVTTRSAASLPLPAHKTGWIPATVTARRLPAARSADVAASGPPAAQRDDATASLFGAVLTMACCQQS